MKPLLRCPPLIMVSLFCLAAPCLNALPPFISMSDDVNVFLTGSALGRYESNIFRDETNKQDDFYLILSPGLEILVGDNHNKARFQGVYRHDFYIHEKHSKLDSQNANIYIDFWYRAKRSKFHTQFLFEQIRENTPEANTPGDLVHHNDLGFFAEGSYELSPKTSAEVGFEIVDVDYRTPATYGLIDYTTYTLPFDLYYRYSPKLDIGPSYRYRHTDIQRGNDTDDHFISLALKGEIAPKFNVRMHVGGQHRNIKGRSNRTTLSVNSEMEWHATPKFTIEAGFNKDFSTGGSNQSIEQIGGYAVLTYEICPKTFITSHIFYTEADYQNSLRQDRTTEGKISSLYMPNNYMNFSASYLYQNNDSNATSSSYMNHMIELLASLRY